ncbi:MAG: hypothetical protein J6C84_01745 [Lachnospiraceae bacterium]|nr:hypothetical protein [Lachnospiraceae bacterium]
MQQENNRKHIAKETWASLENGRMVPDREELMNLLGHIGECTGCAERLADMMEQDGMSIEPPAYLKDQIRERIAQTDVQVAVTIKHTSKNIRLLLYSLKVGAAIAVSILTLALTTVAGPANVPHPENTHREESLLTKLNQSAASITNKLNDMASQIMNGGKQ